MSKKQLHSRLENLFSNLADSESGSSPAEQKPEKAAGPQDAVEAGSVQPVTSTQDAAVAAVIESPAAAPEPADSVDTGSQATNITAVQLSGWTWEIDSNQKYITCGSEVKLSLGIPPERLNGQPMLTCQLHPKSSAKLEKALGQENFPAEVDVYFQNAAGAWVPARVNILKRVDLPNRKGWQGFTQLLPGEAFHQGETTTPPQPAATTPAPTVQTEEVRPIEAREAIREPQTRPINIPAIPKPPKEKEPATGTGPLPGGKAHRGFAIQHGNIQPASKIWTITGHESLEKNAPAFQDTDTETPATIAVPFQMQGVGDLLLEVVDDEQARDWSEDDRFLVMEIVSQLALALDNAQLYMSAQQELAERIRAQQVIVRRNNDLATLNRIGQQLSRLATRAEIFDLLTRMIGEVASSDNLYICTYNTTRQMLSFPVYRENGKAVDMPDQPVGKGIAGYVIQNKEPLLMPEKVTASLLDLKIDLPARIPASLLAIPLVAGDRGIGAIVMQNYEQANAFDNIHLELLSTAASQATTALENADLFQQMQNALAALENRERYQSNVAKAAAILTEFGTKSMPDVLKSLALAAQCSRVYFAQIKEDERGIYWTATSEWIDPAVAYLFDRTRLQHLHATEYPNWSLNLREKGWVVTITTQEQTPEAAFLNSQHIRSSLLLAVPGDESTPSFLAFDQLGVSRVWQSEEINALRVAADAITNTFVREDLLEQLQVSLDETESLYKASNRLALANDMQDMVAAVLSGIRSPSVNRAVLLLFENDSYGKLAQITVGANWYSGRGTPPPSVGTDYPRARYERFLQTQTPLFFEDITEAQVDQELRELMAQQNIHGLAVLPLMTGKRQNGALLVEAEMKYKFSGRETRTYPPLADQMAIAVENQRLFEQTQRALAETELLYNVSNRVAQAMDADQMLTLVVETILPTGADRASLILINSDSNGELLDLEVVGFRDTKGEFQRTGVKLPISAIPIIKSLTDEPLIISDINEYPMDAASRKALEQFRITATCIVPLRTSGHMIGVLTASSRFPTVFDPDETRLLRIVGNGIAVTLEKQRLLREAQRRALELQTASEIARDTTSTLSLDLLLNRIVSLLTERFNFYHASIFLLDDSGSYAVVRESTGEAGKEMKRSGHKLAVGSRSVVGTVTSSGEPFILNDVLRNPLYFPNPLLPETRSEMGLPLKISNKVIGALDMQSRNVNAFNEDDAMVLQILGDQIAIAIENARAYELSQKAIADMKEVDRVKSQFLANMSHELRTPLNSIIGFSRVILKGIDGPVNDTQKQDLTAIYNSGQHLLNLINDILDLSKIDAGKMELAITDVNVADMINSVMSTAVGLVKDKPIKLYPVIPENLPIVRADQTRARQVLINFLSNAAKFTDEGEIRVEASLITSPKTKKPEVMIAVTDSGPGIAPQDQGKLFLPFSQVDDSPTRKTGGTGLGLSICRSLIEMHGGRIGLLRSDVGVGSTFFFTLPANVPAPAPEPVTTAPTSNIILAVDDDQKVINLYERYLKPHGYQVVALTNPKEAVAKAKEIHPFAITLDIMMPEKDGWQVMHELKNNPDTRDLPIIICSIMESQEKGFSMGAADYLVKPFLQEDLINAINRLNRDGQIKQILVVDDDPEDLRLVQKLIEDNQKLKVTLVQGGKNGWDAIQATRPDAIILDLFMPDMNGFAILENLRADPAVRHIPVIILTGADLTPDQHQQLSAFGQGLLAKGFLREKELLVVLEEALRKFKPSTEKPE